MTTPDPSLNNAPTRPLRAPVQDVSFSLAAPTGWVGITLGYVYLLGLIFSAGFFVFLVALMAKPAAGSDKLPGASFLITGYHAFWLWLVGLVLSVSALVRLPTLNPDSLSMVDWVQASPWMAGMAVAASLAAIALGLWHMCWIRSRQAPAP